MAERIRIPQGAGLYYLATPYSKFAGGIHRAASEAALLAGQMIKLGHLVYSPICHSHSIAMAAGLDPLDHGLWLEQDEPLIQAAQALLVAELPGWRDSQGVAYEVARFRNQRKPVWLLDPISLKVADHAAG